MERMEWIAPCHFGLESVLKREIQDRDMKSHRWKMEELPFTEEQMQRAGRMYFSVQQNVFCSRQEVLKQLPLMNCLRRQKQFPGRIIYRRTEVLGGESFIGKRVSCSALRIFSQL